MTSPPAPPAPPGGDEWYGYPGYGPGAAGGGSSHRLARLRAAFRQKWWIVPVCMVLALGGCFAYLRVRNPEYASRSVMWVTGKLQLTDGARFTEEGNFLGTQLELIQSGRMSQRALERIKATNPEIKIPLDDDGLPVVPALKINQSPKSAVFVIEARSFDPNYARVFLDALMDEFLKYKKEVRTLTSGDALTSVAEQVSRQERELKAEQGRLHDFQGTNNIALIEEQMRSGGAQLAQLRSQLSLFKLELSLLDSATLEQAAGRGVLSTNLFSAAPDPRRLVDGTGASGASLPVDFVSASHQIQMLKLQRDDWSRYLRPKHPKMVHLEEEIARAEKVTSFLREQNREQVNSAREALRIRIKSLNDTIDELSARVADANQRMAEYQRILTSISRLQLFYDRLLTLLQGVDINRSMDQEVVSVLQRASSAEPTNRSALKTCALAIATGFAGGILLIGLLSCFDDRCDSLQELSVHFTEEIVGQLPEVRPGRGEKRPRLLEVRDERHVFAESCRSLRSSILFRAVEPGSPRPRVLLVTSTEPGEGKSTVAANLARALALGGARVLLVDADLRRGYLHEVLGSKAEAPGLVGLLSENGDPAAYICPTDLETLHFLPRGQAKGIIGELFLSSSFERFLEFARSGYEYVVFDGIPVFAADDSTTLAPRMDGVLFVVRRGVTSARHARLALDLLYQRQARVLGLVFHRADSRAGSYRFYKYEKYHSRTSPERTIKV